MKRAHDNLIASSGADAGQASIRLAHRPHAAECDWQQELANAIRDPRELVQELGLSPALLPGALRAAAAFPLLLPRNMLRLIRPGDPDDPILRQFLPLGAECEPEPAYFRPDPLQESPQTETNGLIRKYQGRALITLGNSCAVNCRYCFRRSFPYDEHRIGTKEWTRILSWFSAHPEISEAILSGGDPLVISDRRLMQMGDALTAIPSVKRLRIHTRLPTTLPSRVTPQLLEWIGKLPIPLIIVLHCNHPGEIDEEVGRALEKLSRAGAVLMNQSVLLAGINDTADVLERLSDKLFRYKVLPYYLHLLDPVSGSHRFEVPDQRGIEIIDTLRSRLPGYLVPKLVREVPGDPSKRPVNEPCSEPEAR